MTMAAPTTSTPTTKIAINPVSGLLPACQPNLMPFHINYNGPAAVNTFMRVEKLVDTVEQVEGHGCELQVQTESSPEGPKVVSAILAETQSLTTSSDGTLTRTTTESTLVTESSLTTLGGSNSDLSVPSSSFSRFPTDSQDHAPPIEDLDKRFVSSFRGRTIHGLTINLPEGYSGLVLKATTDRLNGFDEKERVTSSGTGRGDVKDIDVDVEIESLGRRRKGRLRSSAAPRKGTVITISDDDNAPQNSNPPNLPSETYDNDVEMADPLSTPNERSLRVLVPTARFDSFTLWQADRMVNKSNDEYWRTLTEWIGLAHEIHNV